MAYQGMNKLVLCYNDAHVISKTRELLRAEVDISCNWPVTERIHIWLDHQHSSFAACHTSGFLQ